MRVAYPFISHVSFSDVFCKKRKLPVKHIYIYIYDLYNVSNLKIAVQNCHTKKKRWQPMFSDPIQRPSASW